MNVDEPNFANRVIRKLTGWTRIFDFAHTKRQRAILLIATVVGTLWAVALIDHVTGSGLYRNLLFPELNTTPEVRAWSARIYAVVLGMGLPVALLLWHWRDRNVQDQIENARKDVNLKEFQEVQLRAAGVLDEKMPLEAREQLQIAALHQLRGFLRGEYGADFKRPALELLLAGHAAAINRVGVISAQQQIHKMAKPLQRRDVTIALETICSKLSPVDRERIIIIRDEFDAIFSTEFSLSSRRFDLIDFERKKFPRNLDLSGSHFFGADFYDAELEDVTLTNAHFEGAQLVTANLKASDCRWSNFQGARLSDAELQDSNFFESNLESCSLTGAILTNAKFHRVKVNLNTSLTNAIFDNDTVLGDGAAATWRDCTDSEKDAVRELWLEMGAINVDTEELEEGE